MKHIIFYIPTELPRGGKFFTTRYNGFDSTYRLNCPENIAKYLIEVYPLIFALGKKKQQIAIWNPIEGLWE